MAFAKIMRAVKDRQKMGVKPTGGERAMSSFFNKVKTAKTRVGQERPPLRSRLSEIMNRAAAATETSEPAPATEMRNRRNLRSMLSRVTARRNVL